MKVLLTGATGFVGKNLVARLSELGHEIIILSRNAQKAKSAFTQKIEAFSWNPNTEAAPKKAFVGVDAVLHLAGESVAGKRWSAAQKQRIRDSRRLGTRNLVQTLNSLTLKPKCLISTSAIGIYGDRGEAMLSEIASPARDGFLSDVCKDWETEARSVDKSIRLAIIRVGVVLGLGGGALGKMLLPFKLGVGGRLGSGTQWMSWIHIDDLINLYIFLMQNSTLSGLFNGVAPEPETNANFTRVLAKTLHRPAIAPAPAFVLKLLLGEMSEILLYSQRCSPAATEAAGFRFAFHTLGEALEDLLGKKAVNEAKA